MGAITTGTLFKNVEKATCVPVEGSHPAYIL